MGGAQSGNGGASGKTMSFGKSRARMINPSDKNRVTFDDVAGVDEEKEELEEIVEFLKILENLQRWELEYQKVFY